MPHKDKETERVWRRNYMKRRAKTHGHIIRGQARERYKIVMDFIRDVKLKSGCVDCGFKGHHAALDFDHIGDNKTINVCNAKSISAAALEMEKCEVVCANCHRIRTFSRMQIKTYEPVTP